MEFADFCEQRIRAMEKILKEEAVQYDKWGEVENKIDLSFDALSDQFIKSYENANASVQEQDTDLADVSDVQGIKQMTKQHLVTETSRAAEAKRDINSTHEIRSVGLRRADSKKIKSKAVRGNSLMQDSREESMSDDNDSSIMIDDSNLEPGKKVSHNNKEVLPADVLRESALNDGQDADQQNKDPNQVTVPTEALDNTNKAMAITRFKYGQLKLEDSHVASLLDHLGKNKIFSGRLDIAGQNLSDQSLLKIAKIIEASTPRVEELDLQRNLRFGTQGISELAESIAANNCLQLLDLGDIASGFEAECRLVDAMCKNKHLIDVNVGIFDDRGLEYFARNLDKIISVKHLSIQESSGWSLDTSNSDLRWRRETMSQFIDNLEAARGCPLLSINILSSDLNSCAEFVGSLSIILENRRSFYLLNKESENLINKIDVETPEIEEMDISEVKDTFLTRRYIENIFKSKVEESLVEIERLRNTTQRFHNKTKATGRSPSEQIWTQSDLMTAQGSIYALAVLLLRKLEE